MGDAPYVVVAGGIAGRPGVGGADVALESRVTSLMPPA
jgi:hypothetical protein